MYSMKKIFSILSAGLVALAAVSCIQEKMTVFDPAQATAPVLASYEVTDAGISATYNPGSFNQNFNTNMPVNHSLVITSVNGASANKMVSATFKDGSVSASVANISKALMALGCAEESYASFEMIIRASMQDVSKDNGLNGHVDSEGKISVSDFFVKVPEVKGNPWKEYTETSPWGLIGSIASTGNSWNADGPMFSTTDGKKHVARNVKFGTDDQFKVRKDADWGTNFGAPGDTEPFVLTVGESIEATPGGKNLGVPAEGFYDLLLDEDAGTLTLYEAYQTYPGFEEVSTWSVIGAIASFEMSWNKDIQMMTDGEWHVAEGVVLTKDDQFKFRKDLDWGTNIGASGDTEPFVVSLDEEYSGANGGKNLAVPADGTYDLLCNPETNAFKIVESLGGKSPLVGGGDEPEPTPTYQGWGIIGAFNDWGGDAAMTEKDGVWTGYFTNKDGEDGSHGQFKFRKDAAWTENLGAAGDVEPFEVTLGTAVEAAANGKNLSVPAGFYKAELNLTDEAAPTITITEGNVWSLIGDFNGWGGDVDMVLTDGKWVSPATKLNAKGFKIRHNHDWAESYGGAFVKLGEAFDATNTGDNNIMLEEEGEYVVTFDLENLKITVDPALPSDTWSVIGSVSGTTWNKDFYMTNDEGVWVSEELEFTESSEFKLRFNNSWADADCIGGEEDGIKLAAGVPVVPVHPGKNLKVETPGKYHVVYDTNKGIVYLQGWALIGSIAGTTWSKDFFMTVGEDGRWWSDAVKISGEFKLRNNSSWADPDTRGYGEDGFKFTPLEAFTVASPGKNINVPEEGIFVVAYDAEKEEVTIYRAEWALIGGIAGTTWSKDFNLIELEAGVYSIASIKLEGEFKIRRNASWDDADTRGYAEEGFAFTSGTKFTVTGPGKNIKTPEAGNYKVAYTPAAEEVLITAVE